MTQALQNRATIWVLKGLRTGDTEQAMALALQLGGRVEGKQLRFTAANAIPNWLLAGRVSHLTQESRPLLCPPWPDMVIATGRRTAPVSAWIKAQSRGQTKLVHIGRPRLPLALFDRIIATPQYGLPAAPNVLEVSLPFAVKKSATVADLEHFSGAWTTLPRPWILGVVGGAKFPVKLGAQECERFGRALARRAKRSGGSVILLDSPRSSIGALDAIAKAVDCPKWIFNRQVDANPYRAALQLCDELVVTSDSVSMVADMVVAGKPTYIFRLPVSSWVPRWTAQGGVAGWLAGQGVLAPPRNVDAFMVRMLDDKIVGDIEGEQTPIGANKVQERMDAVVADIKTLLTI